MVFTVIALNAVEHRKMVMRHTIRGNAPRTVVATQTLIT